MGAAAFYDLDGTLVRTNLVHAFAFSARNQQGILKSITKTVATLASVPMFMAADFYNRRLFNDLFFVRYRGESQDRLRCLAEELFDTVLGINLRGMFFGCKRALAEMLPAGYGKIVNVASVAGLQAMGGGLALSDRRYALAARKQREALAQKAQPPVPAVAMAVKEV